MAFNDLMHPRNPFYKNPPDFNQLAALYPDFSSHCTCITEKSGTKTYRINFHDPNAVKSLTCTLLKHLFGKI